jgi:hypothetical protein
MESSFALNIYTRLSTTPVFTISMKRPFKVVCWRMASTPGLVAAGIVQVLPERHLATMSFRAAGTRDGADGTA